MTDKEIFDITDKAIARYSESIATLISLELDAVRHEVKGLKEEFGKMNGRLHNVCEWKAKQEGIQEQCKESKDSTFKTIGAAVAIIGLLVTIFVGFNRVNEKIDRVQKETEGQSIMMMGGNPRGMADSTLIK